MRNREIILILIAICTIFFLSSFIVVSREDAKWYQQSTIGIWTGSFPIQNTTQKIQQNTCIKNPEITFFMYHYIRDDDIHDNSTVHNLSIPPTLFDAQMKEIGKLRDESIVSLIHGDDFIQSWKDKCFTSKKIWILTTDDSWSDTYTSLAPIARKHSIPFFFGAIENRVDTPGFITKSQLIELSHDPLFTLSSHSMTHNDHSKMNEKREAYEICTSKGLFEKISWKKVETYIYPSGRIGSWSLSLLKKCGYTLAWSTNFWETYHNISINPYILNRTRITRNTDPSFFRDIALGKNSRNKKKSSTLSNEISPEEYLQATPNQPKTDFKSNF